MAVTTNKKKEYLIDTTAVKNAMDQPAYVTAQIQQAGSAPSWAQQAAQQKNAYTGLQGLSSGTSQQLGNMQQGYKPSDTVTAVQQQLQSVIDQKPQTYAGKYDEALNDVMQRIMNPEQFKYSFEGDALFKSLSDRYVQQGKQAMMDTMGQAAALTGGYGNSYAQVAGQQTYDQYLQGLYDKGMDLYDRAWNRYQAGQDQLMDQFGVLSQADQTDYNRYRDTVGDWENERQYYTGRYDTESERDYAKYNDQLNYWTQMAGAENADWNTQQQLAEQKRQWDEQFNYTKMSDEKKNAYNICTAILANGKMPSKTQLKAAGISEADAKKMKAQVKTGGGRGSSSGSKNGENYYYDEKTNKYYKIDENGYAEKVSFNDIPKTGTIFDGAIAQSVLSDAKDKQEKDKLPYSTNPKK